MRSKIGCFLLWVAIGCAQAAWAQQQAADLRLTLPPDCCATVGVPMSIYYDNIVLTETPENFRFVVQCDIGKSEAKRWTLTPEAAQVGDHPLSVGVTDAAGKSLGAAKTVLHVIPADAGAGKSVKLLIIGDSLTSATVYSNQIAQRFSVPGNPSWAMLGTHRPPSAAKGVSHEGYGGWTWRSFVSRYQEKPGPKPYDRGSPFVFLGADGKPALDIPRYFKDFCGGAKPDFITIMLGINDCFGAGAKADDPKAVNGTIDAMFAQADLLLAALGKAAPDAEIGVCLTTPPNSRESGFEANYKGKYHRWGWKKVQHQLVQRQLEHFGPLASRRISIVPTELNLDPVDGYPVNNGVHPNAVGYQQIGDTIYAWLKARLQAQAKAGKSG